MKKRTFLVLLCFVLMLTTLLSACNNDKYDKQEQTTATVEETDAPTDLLEKALPNNIDFGGREFVALTESDGGLQFNTEEFDGDPVNEAMVTRNLYISERFDCVLTTVEGKGDKLEVAHLTQGSDFDLVWPNPLFVGSFMIKGMVTDLKTLDSIDLTGEWWNQTHVETWTCNNHLYALASDATILGQAFGAIVYNVDAYKDRFSTDDLYDVVYAGDWTVEKMEILAKQASAKVEGDETGNFYGLGFWENLAYGMMYGMDVRLLNPTSDGKFELGYTNTRLTAIAEGIASLIYNPEINILSKYGGSADATASNFFNAFCGGNCLFMTWDVGSMYQHLRDLDFEIGYLPNPKLNEEQNGYRVMCSSGQMLIPYYVKDAEQAGTIFNALGVCSYLEIRPTYINKVLLGRLSKQAEHFEMLQFMHNSKFWDIGLSFDTTNEARDIIYNTVIKSGTPSAVIVYMKGHASAFETIVEYANKIN